MERFPLPLGALDGLRYYIVALPEPSNNYFTSVWVMGKVCRYRSCLEIDPIRYILLSCEPRCEKTDFLHMQKQRGISVAQ